MLVGTSKHSTGCEFVRHAARHVRDRRPASALGRCQATAKHTCDESDSTSWPSASRRPLMGALILTMCSQGPLPAWADNEGFPSLKQGGFDPVPPASSPSQPDTPPPAPRPEFFETTEFYFRLPASLNYDPPKADPAAPPRGRQAGPQALRARFVSSTADGAQMTVVAQETAALKVTLFQCRAISQLGSLDQVAQLILPRGAKLLRSSSQKVTEPDRDLIDLALTQPPQEFYRYEFSSVAEGDQLHALLSAVVLAGRLYLVGATSPEGQWAAASSDISSAVTSFRLVKQLR